MSVPEKINERKMISNFSGQIWQKSRVSVYVLSSIDNQTRLRVVLK